MKISKKTCKILIAENDAATVRVLSYKLKQLGIIPDVSIDGEDALQKLKQDHHNLVLIDIRIPKKDGYRVIQEMKQDPYLRDIKIWVMTNLGREESIGKAIASGADEFFIKANLDFNDLAAKLARFCEEMTQESA